MGPLVGDSSTSVAESLTPKTVKSSHTKWPHSEVRGDGAKEPRGPPAIPIALYRLREDFNRAASYGTARGTAAESIGGSYFLVLAPTQDILLRPGDWLVVLAGKSFGRKVHKNGLLRGSGADETIW